MTAETLFSICNTSVMPVWLLLAIAPRWKVTDWITSTSIVSLLLGTIYGLLFLSSVGQIEGGFGSLEGVKQLFANDYILLAGWVHYLAFDLFIGAWEVRDARVVGISHWLVIPCLLFTFMLGPVGLGMYFVLRWNKGVYKIGSDATAR